MIESYFSTIALALGGGNFAVLTGIFFRLGGLAEFKRSTIQRLDRIEGTLT